MGVLGKADLQSSVNMNETLLKLVSVTGEMEELTLTRPEGPFLELNMRAMALKKILSKIPSQINNRQAFLETIKVRRQKRGWRASIVEGDRNGEGDR